MDGKRIYLVNMLHEVIPYALIMSRNVKRSELDISNIK